MSKGSKRRPAQVPDAVVKANWDRIFNMDKRPQILLNRIRTPDGTIITSHYRHDYVTHEDAVSGERYMVDGGRDYLRRSVNKVPAEDLSVYLQDDHTANRRAFHWGTRGPDGDRPLKYVPLAELMTDHIQAILDTQTQIKGTYIVRLMEAELAYRDRLL